jgi:hypothetical protein
MTDVSGHRSGDDGIVEIELRKAVAALRDELMEAARDGAGEQISFAVGTIELEFAVELRADAKAQSGFKAWVISGDVSAGVARGRTQRVKVSLTPTDTATGRSPEIAGRVAGIPRE